MNRFTVEVDGEQVEWESPDIPMLNASINIFSTRNIIKNQILMVYGKGEPKQIVDVGGCLGSFAWLFNYVWPGVEIHTCEPASINYDYLVRNLASYSNVHPHNIGLSDRAQRMTIAMPSTEQKEFMNYFKGKNTGIMSVYGETDIHRCEADFYPLDDVIDECDLIKVDAEGHDYQVMLGAQRLMRECRPLLMLELQPANFKLSGNKLDDYLGLLEKYNYKAMGSFAGNVAYVPLERVPEKFKKLIITYREQTNGYLIEARMP